MSNDLKCLHINFYLLTMFDALCDSRRRQLWVGNVFCYVYKRFFIFVTFLRFLTFCIFIWTFFYIYDSTDDFEATRVGAIIPAKRQARKTCYSHHPEHWIVGM